MAKLTGIIDVVDAAALRALAITPQDSDKVYIPGIGFYDWDPISLSADDDYEVIKPTAVAPDAQGRWVRIVAKVTVCTTYPPPGVYVTKPEGEPLTLTKTLSDGSLRHFFIHPTTGALTMSSGQNIGVNTAPASLLSQFQGSFGGDWFADGADLTVTSADIITAAVAAGVVLRKSDGTNRAVLASDKIVSINVGLKPAGGHVDVNGVQTPTTTSDAKHDRGGRTYDIDPGGSSFIEEMRDHAGFLLECSSGPVVIKDGSGVVIAVNIASVPA